MKKKFDNKHFIMKHRKLIKIALVFFICTFYFTASYCQDEITKKDQWLPQSPEVSSLGLFGTFPVSHFTGRPQISIPLYTLKEHDIEIPITLSYSGSGIRVADLSTWVGLGWNLMPGGYITKIIVGDNNVDLGYNTVFFEELMNSMFPGGDEGIFDHYTYERRSDNLPGGVPMDYINSILDGLSHQPDIFKFNFLGYSGTFYIDQDTEQAVILNKKDHIQFTPTSGSWEVILPNGIKLYFDVDDHEEIINSTVFSGCSKTLTWKLTQVLLLNGEEINFTYTDYVYNSIAYYDMVNYYGSSECFGYCMGFSCPPYVPPPSVTEAMEIENNVNFLAKIESPSVTINFHLTSDTEKPRLDYLEIYHNSDEQVKKKYDLEYGTFSEISTYSYPIDESDIYIKYKLFSLTESGIDNGVEQSKEPYLFEYYEDIGLPSYFSCSQDYWGYFNGINNNDNLLPDERNMFDGASLYYGEWWPPEFLNECHANRGPDRDHMVQGTLHKIIYPTKGYTVFNFEPHEFKIPSTNTHLLTAYEIQYGSNGTTEPNIGAGLRINEIINYDYDDSFISREKYIYENQDQSSSGKLVEFSHFWQKEKKQFVDWQFSGQSICEYNLWQANSKNYQQISFYDNSVGYSRVEIIKSDSEVDHDDETNNGIVTYNFKNYSHFHEYGLQIVNHNAYQYCPTLSNPQNGLVDKIEYHNNNGVKTKEISYNYIRVNSLSFRGIKGKIIPTDHFYIYPYPTGGFYYPLTIELYFYPMHSETWKVEKVTEINNMDNGIGVQSETSFDYTDNDFNLIIKKTTNTSESENTFKTTLYLYPFDYSSGGPEFIYEMRTNNIMTKPI
ncbi:MAG: hypothetical protein K8R68_11725, partial [Bacteroidales bacterium]|nr:hypothetical protein [Bacteroidales bacterium]